MAFNMKRSVIAGTTHHKASIAKAKSKSIVSQAGLQADATLVGAGAALGRSNIGQAIDFSIKNPKIKIDKKKKKKNNKDWTDKDTQEVIEANDQMTLDEAEQRYQDSKKEKKVTKPKKEKKVTKPKKEKKPKGEGWIKKAGKWVKKKAGDVSQNIKDKKAQNEAEWMAKNKAKLDEAEKARLAKEAAANEEAKLLAERKENAPTTINPQRVSRLPTKANKIKLQKATASASTSSTTANKFFDAAERAGIDINNQAGYDKAERSLVYDEEADDWREREAEVTAGEARAGINTKSSEEIAEEHRVAEELAEQQAAEVEKSRQAAENKRDKQMAEANIKASEKETKRLAREKKNEAIRAKNADIRGAKELYGRATKSTIEKYRAANAAQEAELASHDEVIEEDDMDWEEAEKLSKADRRGAVALPVNQPSEQIAIAGETPSYEMKGDREIAEPMMINGVEASESKIRKLDKLWENSQKGGTVRANLAKEGYVPKEER